MKHLVFLVLFGLLVGCGGSDKGRNSNEVRLTVQIDTVIVDPAEEILFLNWGLDQSQLSKDRQYLYNFNRNDFTLEKIDLDKLSLIDKIPLEKEGPNGIGGDLYSFYLLDDDSILLTSGRKNSYSDYNGAILSRFEYGEIGNEEDQLSDEEWIRSIAIPKDAPHKIYGLIDHYVKEEMYLGIFDLRSNEVRRIQLPGFDKFKNYEINFDDGTNRFGLGTSKRILAVEDKIIIGNNVTSRLWILDVNTDSLDIISFAPELTSSEKTGKHPLLINDKRQMDDVYQAIFEEVTFLHPVWDADNERYYRFSLIASFENSQPEEGSRLPSPSGTSVFLTVMDNEFQIIAETPLPMFDKYPSHHFVKDGKIWMFENIGDEMGFVRLSIDF